MKPIVGSLLRSRTAFDLRLGGWDSSRAVRAGLAAPTGNANRLFRELAPAFEPTLLARMDLSVFRSGLRRWTAEQGNLPASSVAERGLQSGASTRQCADHDMISALSAT